MKVWITYFTDSYDGKLWIDRVFDSEEKAKEYIKYKDKMTVDDWNYFDKEVE